MNWERQVGINLRRLRKAKGWSQERLAQEAGLAMRYLAGIERGEENPSLHSLTSLSAALGAHPRDLFAD